MKKVVLIVFVFMVLASSKGRIAWYGEKEFESSVTTLEEEGYAVNYITTIDEETLSVYDVLVICFEEPAQEQRDVILKFVEEGGGLLIIYNVISYPSVEDVLSEYGVENTLSMERDIVFPFLGEETVEELKKRTATSHKGKGRIITVGYDPVTFQAVSLLLNVDSIFVFGMDWLSQEWHVEQTQEMLAAMRMRLLIPVVVAAAVVAAVGGYYVFRRKKKPLKAEPDRSEQIRELKARFVYGELSKDEYQRELEKLEHSTK